MEILNKNPKFVSDILEDFVCTICTKVLNDAYQAKCGCQYCFSCIEIQISKKKEFCPGNSKSCGSTKVNMTSIVPNYITNRKIENLQIECLYGECKYVCTLSEMEDHMRSCDYGEAQCVYGEMGCSVEGVSAREMKKHLVNAAVEHAALLATWTGQMRNDVEEKRKQNVAERMRLEEKIETLRVHIETLMAQTVATVNVAIADERRRCKDDMEKQQKMNDENEKQHKKLETEKVLDKIDEEIEREREKKDEEELKQQKKYEETIITRKFTEFKKMLKPGEMIWKVESLIQKRQKSEAEYILSEPFFSHLNGYKLCLKMHLDGAGSGKGDHLGLYVSIMRGPNDDIVSWPCKKRFHLQLLNMDTGESHITHTISQLSAAGGKKPTTDRNRACGYGKFFSWVVLNSDESLKKNDTMIVKCSCM